MKMNEFEEKLVEALESGRYEQTRGALKEADRQKFCCLGVACEISEMGKWETTVHKDTSYVVDNNEMYLLPYPVFNKIGWASRGGVLTPEGKRETGFESLVEANDAGTDFKTIASWIRKGYVKKKNKEWNDTH